MSLTRRSRRVSDAQAKRHERKFVTALARGLRVLEAFQAERELGHHEIAEITGLPKTTVTRLTYTLTYLGYLRQTVRHGKYVAGAGFLGLSASINRNLGVQRVARPYMERLSDEFDCATVMGMRDRLAIVFLEIARPPRSELIFNIDTGSHVPITKTAIGMAYLVAAPLPERTSLIEALQAEAEDDRTMVRSQIESTYASYRRRHFVLQERSWSSEINAVATPLTFHGAGNVYSFMCGGPSRTMSRRRLAEEVGPRLVATVAELRAELERTPVSRLPGNAHVALGQAAPPSNPRKPQ